MQYSPPPLFKQGASARLKVIVFALMAIALLVVDSRLQSLSAVRQMVGAALFPLQSLALAPRDAAYAVGSYFVSLRSAQRENSDLRRQQIVNGQMLQQGQLLLAENAQLRRLMGASQRLPVKAVLSDILYDTRDSFSRKLVLDRGEHHGVVAGQPAIDDIGVVGQVTRVFPFTSEVTLLTDKNHAISVQVLRSGVRSVAFGRGQAGLLDLRFIAASADIRKGDVLVTSGIDGVYPPGLAVATVTQVEHKSGDAFASVVCQPAAGIDRHKQLLILSTEARTQAAEGPAAAPAGTTAPPASPGSAATVQGAATNLRPATPAVAPTRPVILTKPVGAAAAAPVASKPAPTPAPNPAPKPASKPAPKTVLQTTPPATSARTVPVVPPVQKVAPAAIPTNSPAPRAPAVDAVERGTP